MKKKYLEHFKHSIPILKTKICLLHTFLCILFVNVFPTVTRSSSGVVVVVAPERMLVVEITTLSAGT